MNQASSKIWIPVVLSIFIIGGILVWQLGAQKTEVPLSVLTEKIEQGQVESITIQGHKIDALLKDGTHLYFKKEAEISLTESFLNYGVSAEKLKNIEIGIKEEGFLKAWFLPIILFLPLLLFPLLISFLVIYFLTLAGFKFFHITGIPRSKIVVYIFVIFFLGLLLKFAILPTVFKVAPNKIIFYSTRYLIHFLVVFLLIKYYFQLSGKKLWQFFLYLVILSLIFSGIMILLQLS